MKHLKEKEFHLGFLASVHLDDLNQDSAMKTFQTVPLIAHEHSYVKAYILIISIIKQLEGSDQCYQERPILAR